MARKSIDQRKQQLLMEVEKATKASASIQDKLNTLSKELNLITEFSKIKAGDFIDTSKGKGTVLNVITSEQGRKLRIYTGAGETAQIVVINYWEFLGSKGTAQVTKQKVNNFKPAESEPESERNELASTTYTTGSGVGIVMLG